MTDSIKINIDEASRLAELEQKLALLMINTEENFVLIDTNLLVVNFNNQFKKQYKLLFNKDVIKGESILKYVQPERIEIVKNIYTKVFAGEIVESEIQAALPDKTIITVHNKFKPAFDEDETIIGAFVSSKDITEKIKSEQQLIASEKRFRALIENAEEIIALTDKDGKVTYASPALERITGFTLEDMKDKQSFAVMHPDEIEESMKILDLLIQNPDITYRRVNRFLHKSGHYVWVEGTVINLLHNENVQAIVYNYRDITERRNAEDRIRHSDSNLRAIFDNSSEGLMLLDKEGVIKAFNSKSAENHLLYIKDNDLQIGNLLIDYIETARKPYFQNMLSRVLMGETIEYDIDYDKADGTKQWFNASLTPVIENGTISGICIARSNISERKIAEEKLKQSHEILVKLTENVATAIYKFAIDDQNKISFPFMSKSIERIVPGTTAEQILEDANVAFGMVHPDDIENLLASIEVSRRNLSDWVFEYRVVLNDNNIKWLKSSSRPEKEKSGNEADKVVWYGYIEDITESKKDEIRLQNLLNVSSDQNKRLQNFSYIVSHNIRSHSSNIIGLVDFIKNAGNEDDKAKLFNMLKTSTDKLGETIENLNEIITIRNDDNIEFKEMNLKNEIDKTKEVINSLITQTNTTITNNVDENVMVNVIPSYLESIILNLLTNAIKYRSPLRNPDITINSQTIDGYHLLTVEDNGLGIDLNKNGEKIFGMYKTFHNNKDARGFGLFLSKNQIESMNGKIEVESEPEKGSKFKIYIKHEEN